MELFEALVTVLVFFALTPGVLLTLPVGNKYVVALVHGVVFFTVLYFLNGGHTENFRTASSIYSSGIGNVKPMRYAIRR